MILITVDTLDNLSGSIFNNKLRGVPMSLLYCTFQKTISLYKSLLKSVVIEQNQTKPISGKSICGVFSMSLLAEGFQVSSGEHTNNTGEVKAFFVVCMNDTNSLPPLP